MNLLSIVIPIFNEEAILEREVEAIIAEMSSFLPEISYELLLVENGSHDRTRAIAEELVERHPQIRVLLLPTAGYGQALKHGLLQSRGEYIVLFNIDFWDVPFVRKALALKEDGAIDMIVGSKTMPGAEDARPFVRRLITKTFNKLLNALFGFSGTDTHGMKLIEREKIVPVIQACRTEREIFDTEFVLRAEAAGLSTREVPVMCAEKRKTTYRISKRIPRTVKDLIVLFFTLRSEARSARYLRWLLAASLVFFVAAAWWGFPDSPAPWFDQGVNLGIARTWAEDGVYSLRLAPGQYVAQRGLMISTNYPVLAPLALMFKLFGAGLHQAQIVMFLFLVAFLPVMYRWIREYASRTAAVLATGLVVTFLPFYGNGLSGGLGEVPGLLFFFLGLLLINKQQPRALWLAGLCFGLAAATKVFYLVLLGAVALEEVVWVVKERQLPFRRWLVLIAGAVPPLLVWLYTLVPDGAALGSLGQVLEYYRNPYDVGGTVTANLRRFITETTPLHFLMLAVAFAVYFIYRAKERRLVRADVIIAAFVALNVVWWLKTPGWYRYLFPAHLTLLALFPAVLLGIGERLKFRAVRQYLVPSFLIALIALQGIHLMLGRNDRLYYNPAPREFARSLDERLEDGGEAIIIDHPELWFLVKHRAVEQYMQMNPYVAFGRDIFVEGQLPRYVVSSEIEQNSYLSAHKEKFEEQYRRIGQHGSYVIFERR